MKKKLLFLGCGILFMLVACSNQKPQTVSNSKQITPGTVMACDSMRVTNDPLNHFYFSVKVVANEASKYGTYTIKASYGPNEATSQFTMPKGGEHFLPVIQKGTEPYTYIVGFHYENNKTFYDYYQVSAQRGQIAMKYLKAYSFK